MKISNNTLYWIVLSVYIFISGCNHDNVKTAQLSESELEVHIVKDVVIYKDTLFFSSFPSVIKRPDGKIIVVFRRSPDHRIFGETYSDHVDPNSNLVKVSSTDGETWTKEAELVYAHPFGGSQDPCLLQLNDGTLLCTSYGWRYLTPKGISNLKKPFVRSLNQFIFLGGYLIRSTDGGDKWQDPIYPPHVKGDINYSALGIPVPAYNRGALYEGVDGRVFWAVAATDSTHRSTTHLIISTDKGLTWDYSSPIASDSVASFNETSVYETPKGDIIAFIRSANYDDQACIARSTDGGKTFQKWKSMGFQGHPLQALRLPDNRVLLTYGYRHKPYGIRARILNAECTDYSIAPEIILREDGGTEDLGYTWSTQLTQNRVLVTYYFNKKNGTRYIAGTILEFK